jgi:hypothetical protein
VTAAQLAAHADWSVDPRKRWVAVAARDGDDWTLGAPEPVGPVATFIDNLRARAGGGGVALGVDLPIGVPRAYAAARDEDGFLAFLARTADWPDFYRVCATLSEIGPERPFYPARGRKGMTRAAHAAALGMPPYGAALSRLCDQATAERPAGAPVFWTLGANQSGKAAAAAWQEMLLPALQRRATIRVWPFDGPFRALLEAGRVAIAETYPAEALRHLGIRLAGSKRRQADRAAVADGLRAAMARLRVRPDRIMNETISAGFGADAAGEDRFDCTLGLLCVLNVLAGHRPDTAPDLPWLRDWEGWVLGQTALPRGC